MKIVKILSVLLLGFIGGLLFATWILWPVGDAVKIRVINESEINIASVAITHEDGSVSINALKSGSSKIIPVHVGGESSYSIVANFENGASVGGDGGYVEPGYRVTETVKESKIQHKFESFY